jgi:hypothetical protein
MTRSCGIDASTGEIVIFKIAGDVRQWQDGDAGLCIGDDGVGELLRW